MDARARSGRAGAAMVRSAGARNSRRTPAAVGSVSLVGTTAAGAGAAGDGVSPQLDSLRASVEGRAHRAARAHVVLRRDSPDGGGVRVSILPRSGALARRVVCRRRGLFFFAGTLSAALRRARTSRG